MKSLEITVSTYLLTWNQSEENDSKLNLFKYIMVLLFETYKLNKILS